MRYSVQLLKRAEKDLAALPKQDRLRIAARIEELSSNPRPHGAEPLKGELSGHWKFRVGDYRVVYQIQDDVLVVVVVRIGNRREVYR